MIYVLQTRFEGSDQWQNAVFAGPTKENAHRKALEAHRAEIWETIHDDEEYNEEMAWTELQKTSLANLETLEELAEWTQEHMGGCFNFDGWDVE